ncbi:uncharacterized protein LOC62_03G004565 [Vanrija pseudolonga]|uniref:Uncharacterized protein n=1 Tax=Vanrija pseudolonga TaxID=143232 RepID=A0AAF0Y6V9_9TREE|nr:hypothetical protein LOC62_03G004565 [Vanrija pseudolonga]
MMSPPQLPFSLLPPEQMDTTGIALDNNAPRLQPCPDVVDYQPIPSSSSQEPSTAMDVSARTQSLINKHKRFLSYSGAKNDARPYPSPSQLHTQWIQWSLQAMQSQPTHTAVTSNFAPAAQQPAHTNIVSPTQVSQTTLPLQLLLQHLVQHPIQQPLQQPLQPSFQQPLQLPIQEPLQQLQQQPIQQVQQFQQAFAHPHPGPITPISPLPYVNWEVGPSHPTQAYPTYPDYFTMVSQQLPNAAVSPIQSTLSEPATPAILTPPDLMTMEHTSQSMHPQQHAFAAPELHRLPVPPPHVLPPPPPLPMNLQLPKRNPADRHTGYVQHAEGESSSGRERLIYVNPAIAAHLQAGGEVVAEGADGKKRKFRISRRPSPSAGAHPSTSPEMGPKNV